MEMGLVNGLVFVCLFLIGLCAIEHYFQFSRLPYISWIVLFGIAYGMLNQWAIINLPPLNMTPDVILYIFLPILIFDSSRKLDLKMSRKEALPASLLATLGILASMFIMALLLRLITDLNWIDVAGRTVDVAPLENSQQRLSIGGSEMPWMGTQPEFSQAGDDFRLLLSHSPDNLPWAKANGVGPLAISKPRAMKKPG